MAFVHRWVPRAYDVSEAQYRMNCQIFGGREITVALAAENRKRLEDMRSRARIRPIEDIMFRGNYGYENHRPYHCLTLALEDAEINTLVLSGDSRLPRVSPDKSRLERSPHYAGRLLHRGSRLKIF